jgi:ATP-dependent helicase/nuclease subunit A
VSTATRQLSDAEGRRAIATALDDTVIVEAAAGTGKTTELVGRIVRIVADGHATIEQVVAVTFTEKAAGELKLRLRERLDRERAEAAGDRGRRGRLDAALMQLEEAHISTIHGFCADLLRERPVEAGVDPLFEVLTEPAAARMFDDVFARWLQDRLADPFEGVRRALRRSAFGGEDGPVDRLRNAAWELAGWRDFTAPWTRDAFDRRAEIDATVSALHDLAALTRDPASRNDPLCTGTEPVRRLSDEIALRQAYGDATSDAEYDEWEAGLVDLSRDRVLANAKQGRGPTYGARVSRSEVLASLEHLRTRLDRFRMEADADLAARLQQELREPIDRYEALKARAGALDFLDLLLQARNLVRDHAHVRRGFQQRFTRVFVDEFQDSDPLQAEILLLLAADDPDETDWRRARPAPGRLFLVGDPKQSIYRFRRADVGIYRDVCRQLEAQGARRVRLTRSFRSVPGIQACVNAAFAPVMTGDELTLQASYVPLEPHRPALSGQPAVVALPVPEPYARRYVSGAAIEASLPSAVGAFVEWVLDESGWQVTERSGAAPVPVAARHVCLLFRRFVSWQTDVTRPYVAALEARSIPHVLVGGRAFHEREEIEAIRAALTAIEWPDDELSVFATLRGPFFAIGDEELLEWAHRFGRRTGTGFRRAAFHPHRLPEVFTGDVPAEVQHLQPIAEALGLLKRLHRHRNAVFADQADGGREWGGASGVLHELLRVTRAHVGFALRRGGEQALANVLHVAELARQYELAGGLSFRGFVDELHDAADRAQAAEAPILEEDSDGVRMMTVHKAKGLEFPVVILVDLTCRLSRPDAGRWIDPEQNRCAIRLGGWTPTDLQLHGPEEAARDRAEGERLAYVAATRARDVLVVPVIGDDVYEGGWLDPLMPAVYPPAAARRAPDRAAGVPAFPSRDSVLKRPDGDPASATTVAPGAYTFPGDGGRQLPTPNSQLPNPEAPALCAGLGPRRAPAAQQDVERVPRSGPATYQVVWWDPHALALDAAPPLGLRRDDLIAKDVDPEVVRARLEAHQRWLSDRAGTIARASRPSLSVARATGIAAAGTPSWLDTAALERVAVEQVARSGQRPAGPLFGSLVHATLATVPFEASEAIVRRVAGAQGRILLGVGDGANEEVAAAVEVVLAALGHPLFDRVRAAGARGRCWRELPIIWPAPDGLLVEGTIDLVFEDTGGLNVLDFKTGRELDADGERYRRQVAIYCLALGSLRGQPARGTLMRI